MLFFLLFFCCLTNFTIVFTVEMEAKVIHKGESPRKKVHGVVQVWDVKRCGHNEKVT